MRARTNLTGAVEGSLVIFYNGYQGKVVTVEDARVKVSVPLLSGNGVKLNIWLDKKLGSEYTPRKAKSPALEAHIKTAKAYNKVIAAYEESMTHLIKEAAKMQKLEVKDFTIQKVEKRKYVVCVDLPTGKTTVDKTFKSITRANEWCALHLAIKR